MTSQFLYNRALVLLLPLSLLLGCSSLTPSAESEVTSASRHRAMLSDPTARGIVEIPQLEEYLNEVMQKIVRAAEPSQIAGKTFHVYIAATAGSGVGADVYPDNTIYVRWNTIAALSSEDQLGALLAHEVSHVLLSHGQSAPWLTPFKEAAEFTVGMTPILNEVYSNIGQTFWSRKQELEADALGLTLMSKAGYNPNAYFDLFQILEAASPPADIPSSFSTMLANANNNGSTEVPIGRLRFGSAEKTHPDFTERRAALNTLIKVKRTELSFPAQQQDRYDLIRHSTSVAPSLRGIEAAISAMQAVETTRIDEARAQLQIARNSPIGNMPDLELLSLVIASGTKAQYLLRLQDIATTSQSPIIYSMMVLGASFETQNWKMGSDIGRFIQSHYDPPPKLLPMMRHMLNRRQEELAAAMPHIMVGDKRMPIPTKGREREFEEFGQVQKASLKLGVACAKSKNLWILGGCQ